jgi:NADPH:quinone reductase-like Zn-dependent oxidoreductase
VQTAWTVALKTGFVSVSAEASSASTTAAISDALTRVQVTGASSGIGKATALKFANAGARIVCADLKSVGLEEEINKDHGADRAVFVTCDVTKEDQVQNLIQEAVGFGGRLDCKQSHPSTLLPCLLAR